MLQNVASRSNDVGETRESFLAYDVQANLHAATMPVEDTRPGKQQSMLYQGISCPALRINMQPLSWLVWVDLWQRQQTVHPFIDVVVWTDPSQSGVKTPG